MGVPLFLETPTWSIIPETNSLHLKMGGGPLESRRFLLETTTFRCELLVYQRVIFTFKGHGQYDLTWYRQYRPINLIDANTYVSGIFFSFSDTMNKITSLAPEIESMLYDFGFVPWNEIVSKSILFWICSYTWWTFEFTNEANSKMHRVQATHAEKDANCTGCRTLTYKVADLSPIHVRKQAATDGTYGSKYWFPGFGFDSGPNLQPWYTTDCLVAYVLITFVVCLLAIVFIIVAHVIVQYWSYRCSFVIYSI